MTDRPFSVVVSAGTYHLPFNRLVDWVEGWASNHPGIKVILQHGVSRALPGAENHPMLDPESLLELYRTADAVVLQGGAGGVMDAREALRKPIVVPRVPGGGEVVDRHQIEFAQRLNALDIVYLAETQERLSALLDAAMEGTLLTRVPSAEPTAGADNAMRLLAGLPAPISGRTRRRRVRRSAVRLILHR